MARPQESTGIRPSPSARRATQLLTYLAGHRGHGFIVSELARAVGLNRATCQAVLMALEESGFVRRDPRTKAYSLGPALIPLGEAALSSLDVVDDARPEIDRLASITGVEAVGAVALDGQMIIIAVAGMPHRFGAIRVGQTVPLRPPFGTAFVAWSDEATVKTWLDRAGALSDELRASYLASLAAVRERGYSVMLEIRSPERFRGAIEQLRAEETEGDAGIGNDLLLNQLLHEEYSTLDGDQPGAHRIEQITVPVFDSSGDVPLVIGLTGFAHDLTLEQLSGFAAPLVMSSHRLTGRLGGRPPRDETQPRSEGGRRSTRKPAATPRRRPRSTNT